MVADAPARPPTEPKTDLATVTEQVSISTLSASEISFHACADTCLTRSVFLRLHRRVILTLQELSAQYSHIVLDRPLPATTVGHAVNGSQRRLSRQLNSSVVLDAAITAKVIRGHRSGILS